MRFAFSGTLEWSQKQYLCDLGPCLCLQRQAILATNHWKIGIAWWEMVLNKSIIEKQTLQLT